ncbi:DUF2993 domain-containing protein [Cyanobacterium stanieri LEGE 03274]|uniref:DUF2993 domain-containing protein n=1 Tax=Cyanobacterium stanieri LEGE 03274 TaxID=1828756 RepID=A0ABR9V927_9CHRO|nr:DUF2993 domain-containing protein [Cyanobacterium stanieri]MBE9223354.1 DUF2993 domain-containing protein [Cyanobacterium stanieri LEGE 03274]
MNIKKKSEIISSFITPAIKLWIRTQVESITKLDVTIDAGDKQILTGKINQVNLQAKEANYRGIFLNYASVATEKIAINLGGILRGKPLKLLHPIFVSGNIIITASELSKSLDSSLLQDGLQDMLKILLNNEDVSPEIINQYHIEWHNITMETQRIIIEGSLLNIVNNTRENLVITSNLNIEKENQLLLTNLQIEGIKELSNRAINDLTIDLGNDVSLSELTISSQELHCIGTVKVVS